MVPCLGQICKSCLIISLTSSHMSTRLNSYFQVLLFVGIQILPLSTIVLRTIFGASAFLCFGQLSLESRRAFGLLNFFTRFFKFLLFQRKRLSSLLSVLPFNYLNVSCVLMSGHIVSSKLCLNLHWLLRSSTSTVYSFLSHGQRPPSIVALTYYRLTWLDSVIMIIY